MEIFRIVTKIPSLREVTGNIFAWLRMSRPSFHSVGILPFILGTCLAWKIERIFLEPVFWLGILAVILTMLSAYHAGEYFDHEEDTLSKSIFKSRFAGGSGIIPEHVLSRRIPFLTSLLSLFLAGILGLVLQFVFRTGPYTLLLGCLGALPGFFYSAKPVRLVSRGCGELFIAFCYGWLPVAAAYYLQTGFIHPIVHWISLPIALTIYNVMLLNEFPDYEADKAVRKRNLLVRLGPQKGVFLFAMISIAVWPAMAMAVWVGISGAVFHVYLPIGLLSILILFLMIRKWHEKPRTLEILCGMNIAVNLGTTAALIYALLR